MNDSKRTKTTLLKGNSEEDYPYEEIKRVYTEFNKRDKKFRTELDPAVVALDKQLKELLDRRARESRKRAEEEDERLFREIYGDETKRDD